MRGLRPPPTHRKAKTRWIWADPCRSEPVWGGSTYALAMPRRTPSTTLLGALPRLVEDVLAHPGMHRDRCRRAGIDRPRRTELGDVQDRHRRLTRLQREPRPLLTEEQDAVPGQLIRLDRPRAGQVVNPDDRYSVCPTAGWCPGRPVDQVLDGRVVVLVLVSVGHHGPPTVPSALADNVKRLGVEGVRGPDHRPDVEVVAPVLDRNVEVEPVEVQVAHDGLVAPVAVLVHDVAAVALGQQLLVIQGQLGLCGPRTRPRSNSNVGQRPVGQRAGGQGSVRQLRGSHRVVTKYEAK